MAKSEALAALIKRAEEIAASQGPSLPFKTKIRPKDRPGDPNFIGPVEPIGPNQLTPQTRIGPGERQGPPEMQGPRQITPQTFIGPAERQGPVRVGTDFTMVNPPSRAVALRDVGSETARIPSTDFTMVNPPSRAVAMRTIGSEAAAPEAPINWLPATTAASIAGRRGAASAGPSGSYLPLFAGSVLGGTALLSAGQQAQEQDRANRFGEIYGGNATSAPYSLEEANRNAAINAIRGRQEFEQGPIGSGRGAPPPSMENYLRDRAGAEASNAALDVARARTAPLPPARPAELRPQSGGLASLFSDPYAGKSSRELYEMAQNMRDDEYGANLMNIRAARVGRDEGMASGGAATGKSGKMEKDAALHKALDIIAHMLGRH